MTHLRKQAALTTVVILLLLSFSTAALSGGKEKGNPKFFVRKKVAELGEFYEGVDIKYEFEIRNNGVGELHILNVRPG